MDLEPGRQHFPEATQIVDLYHAREHLHDLAKLLAFMLGDHYDAWLAGRIAELDAGDIPALLSAARAFPLAGTKAGELDTALGYFETNAHRMRYKHFRSSACSSAPAPSKPAARPSSANASNSPACTGPSPARPASSPCAASKPAAGGKRSGSSRPTGLELPDPPSDNGTHSDHPGQARLPISHLHSCPTPRTLGNLRECQCLVPLSM